MAAPTRSWHFIDPVGPTTTIDLEGFGVTDAYSLTVRAAGVDYLNAFTTNEGGWQRHDFFGGSVVTTGTFHHTVRVSSDGPLVATFVESVTGGPDDSEAMAIVFNDVPEDASFMLVDLDGMTNENWTAGNITVDDVDDAIFSFDYWAPLGASLNIELMPGTAGWGELVLGELEGTGGVEPTSVAAE